MRIVRTSWSVLPLRLIVGYGCMAHGYAKLVNGPQHFAAILQALGVPAPPVMAWVTILCELAGGAAVLVGASRRRGARAERRRGAARIAARLAL